MIDDKDEFTRCILLDLVRDRMVSPETAKDFIEEARHVYRFADIEDWLAGVSPDIAEALLRRTVNGLRGEKENVKFWWILVGSFIVW